MYSLYVRVPMLTVNICVWDFESKSLTEYPQGGRSTLSGTMFKILATEKKEMQDKRRRVYGDRVWYRRMKLPCQKVQQ